MQNPGIKNLGDRTITTALTGEVITASVDGGGAAIAFIDRMEGLSQLDVQFKFAYGSGGTSLKAYLQTSLDQGQSWIDLWCFTATTASKTRQLTLIANGQENTPTDGAHADDTVASGIVFGDRFRVKATSTGVYAANSMLSVRANAR